MTPPLHFRPVTRLSLHLHHLSNTFTMVQLSTILAVASFLALSSAQQRKSREGPSDGLSRSLNKEAASFSSRSLTKRQSCSGSCASCFGSGYTECPGSSIYCYLPGDSSYGLDSCPGQGSGSGSGSTAAPVPTTTGTAGNSDFCSGKGATCVSCFGPG